MRIYSQPEAEAVDDWLRDARRRLGHRVDQARLVRELLRIVTDDPALTARLYDRLAQAEQHNNSGR